MCYSAHMQDESTSSTPPKKVSPKIIIVILVVLAILAGVGFFFRSFVINKISGNLVEQEIENQTDGKADVDLGGDAQWPATMPSDVPQFTPGTIVISLSSQEKSGTTWSVMLKDVTQADADAYKARLTAAGWQSDQEISAIVAMTQYIKGDLTLTLAFDPSSSGVQLVVLQEKNSSSWRAHDEFLLSSSHFHRRNKVLSFFLTPFR